LEAAATVVSNGRKNRAQQTVSGTVFSVVFIGIARRFARGYSESQT
jgi:hypothetical protein